MRSHSSAPQLSQENDSTLSVPRNTLLTSPRPQPVIGHWRSSKQMRLHLWSLLLPTCCFWQSTIYPQHVMSFSMGYKCCSLINSNFSVLRACSLLACSPQLCDHCDNQSEWSHDRAVLPASPRCKCPVKGMPELDGKGIMPFLPPPHILPPWEHTHGLCFELAMVHISAL